MGVIADQREALRALIATVPDIGKVYRYQKLPEADWGHFVESYSAQIAGYLSGADHVRAWTVQYVGERRREYTTNTIGTNKKYDLETDWIVRGYFSLADNEDEATPSEEVFTDLLEVVADTILGDPGLGGFALYQKGDFIIDLDRGVPRSFADLFVHYAEVRMTYFTHITLTV